MTDDKTVKISIHAPHEGERRKATNVATEPELISIHAPHEGERRKAVTCSASRPCKNFNPRSPRGGATTSTMHQYTRYTFQSTLPTRGSDAHRGSENDSENIISIHAPHEGERQEAGFADELIENISIHAPHEGERHDLLVDGGKIAKFQSTLPTRGSDGATALRNVPQPQISIHAPHEGERRIRLPSAWPRQSFQSTLPTRGSDGCG